MTSAIYQEQRKLSPALIHAFLGALNNGPNTSQAQTLLNCIV